MPTTQIFAELLVIGIGGMAWIALFAAAAFKFVPPLEQPDFNAGVLLAFTGFAYVLGIIIDRLARVLWCKLYQPKENDSKENNHISQQELERLICRDHERLWSRCVYNRSRLRVCRAWTLNLALIAIGYTIWAVRVDLDTVKNSVVVVVFILLMLCILAGWATVQLNRDYYKELNILSQVISNPDNCT